MFAAILILGVAWFTVSALSKAASRTAESEILTGQALNAGKRALLGYVALKAADSNEDHPGRLPCPESLGQPGTAAAGIAAPVVVPSFPTCSALGRLPWRTLGIDQLRDGHGEPLWYVVSTGIWALVNSGTSLTINPGLGNQLPLDGQPNAVVALIIAPGTPINSMSEPGVPPAGCANVNQQANRYTVPYDPVNFLECGNATGSYITAGAAPWGNDRVIAITAADVMGAISGPVADRLQRQVAPAMNDWRTTQSVSSWGVSFLPYASSWIGNPATNDFCGDNGVWEGLPPIAGASNPGCSTSWSCASPPCVTSLISPLLGLLATQNCVATGPNMQCSFQGLMLGAGLFSARITVTAPQVANSFRAPITALPPDITVSPSGGSSGVTISNFSLPLSPSTGDATLSFDISQPFILPGSTNFTVTIRNLPDAAILSDPRITWFLNNNWYQYTYYAAAPSATVNPVACAALGDPGCIEVHGLPLSSIGNYWEKRLVLALMGPALPGQSRACTDALDANGLPGPNLIPDCDEIVNYLEEENKSTGNRIFRADLRVATPPPGAPQPYPAFNDRLAVCPYQLATASGSTTICN